MEGAVRLRDRAFPKAKITVLTNGMGLLPRLHRDHAGVRRALERVDRPCLKLHAGTEPLFQRLSRPAARATLAEWTQAAQNLRPLMLQTLFADGAIDNTEARELEALFARYRELAPSTSSRSTSRPRWPAWCPSPPSASRPSAPPWRRSISHRCRGPRSSSPPEV